MEYYSKELPEYHTLSKMPKKENIVVFPHRKAPEKNLDLFLQLRDMMPEYTFVIAMDHCTSKKDYHDLLYRSKVAFSAAFQETLGISMGIETLRAQCWNLVPDRLSYAELFHGSPMLFTAERRDKILCRVG